MHLATDYCTMCPLITKGQPVAKVVYAVRTRPCRLLGIRSRHAEIEGVNKVCKGGRPRGGRGYPIRGDVLSVN